MRKILILMGLLVFILSSCTSSYTISFESNGGTEVKSINVDEGKTIAVPTISREGYTLEGWYTSLNGGETFDERWSFTNNTVNSDITLFAKWTINQYTITFDTDGGSEISPITQDYNTEVTAPNDPTREGYTFLGWDEAIPETMGAEHLSLTALWQINQYTITFDTDGGNSIDPITQEYDTDVIAPSDPVREGYTFLGWDQKIPTTMPAEKIVITALWQVNQYTITFNLYNNSTDINFYNYGQNISHIAIREGYTFIGWYLDEGFTEALDFNTMPAKNIEVYAKWQINQYTITYEDYDGSIIYQKTYDYDQSLSQVSVDEPERIGYTFIGWDISIPDWMPANDITIRPIFQIGIFAYTIIGSNIIIEGCFGCPTNLLIPNSIEGYKVTEIRDLAFQSNNLTSVTIPDTVTTIGDWAFNNNNLTSIAIPDSVTTIGMAAFQSNNLTSVTIGESVTTIGTYAFNNNNLTSVTIPDSVTTIGTRAFYFLGLDINLGVNSHFKIENELLLSRDGTYLVAALETMTSITIPNSVTTIGTYAFYNNDLTSVTIPDSVTTIEREAFRYNDLTSVTIPDSVTTIGTRAFDFLGLDINLGVNSHFKIENRLLLSRDGTYLVAALETMTSITIPNSVTTIGDWAFYNNDLTSVTIPDSVTTIGTYAFYFNDLTSVTIPDSVTTIELGAFSRNNLTSVTIGESVTIIGRYSFSYNDLTSVTIPDSVTTIEYSAFDFLGLDINLGVNSHFKIENGLLLSRDGTYLVAALETMTSITIPNSVTTIGTYAFRNNDLTSVTIPDSVTTIEREAFSGNDLTSVTIPDSVTTIGFYAFYNNDLTNVTIMGDETRFNSIWYLTGFPLVLKPES